MQIGGPIIRTKDKIQADAICLGIASACLDAKGLNLALYEASQISDLAEKFLIVSGRSDRHVQGITNRILENMQKQGVRPQNLDGYDTAHWIVMDFGAVIVHIFYEPIRSHYDLEGLWHRAQKIDLELLIKKNQSVAA